MTPQNWQVPARPLAAQPQAYSQPPAQWQPAQAPPATVRGVSAETPARFVLPSPEALGVSANLSLPRAAAAPAVDWNLIQARLERLKVLAYDKDRPQAGVIRVRILLPTSDPARGQPVVAQAETEAAAIVLALDAAEAWMQKR